MKPLRPASVMAVASGKGGVGKTNVAVNLAVALARLRHRVGLLDADFGLGNVDVLLGLAPERHIGHLVAGEATLQDIMTFFSEDPAARDAVVMQRAVVEHMPQAPASRCFRILAARMASLDPARGRRLRPVTDAGRTIPVTEVPQCA